MYCTRHLLLVTAALTLPITGLAHNYNFVEGGYIKHHSRRDDDSGLRFAGSAAAAPLLALIAEYADTGDFNHLTGGLQFHAPLHPTLDIQIAGTIDSVDLGRRDDFGQGFRGGLRWIPGLAGVGNRLEIIPEMRRVYIFNESETSFRTSAVFHVLPTTDFMASAQTGDDDRFELGLRYNFKSANDRAAQDLAAAEKAAAERAALYDTAYRAAMDAMRDAAEFATLEKAEADRAATAEAAEKAAADKERAQKRAAARKAAAARRQQATGKSALACTPECCSKLQESSQLPPAIREIRPK